ncbi:universal stress protein [Halobacteria archaeon AArc-m2/3/4]|uniref:Universal stress protein n=1 Tax=Natronoglomus mannanivorans TaxID=2979990 RepID=A0AAP2Z3I0_9EURY|nr:universal stress protein [Halobacteria archaeon AArc-xg1-1]MCU4974642.1 universal stress protein [Halobacteria archaeon AArc-m2/3/4]
MYHDLLIPTDGSDGTRQALVHGLAIARRFDATVHALSVLPEGPYGSLESDESAAEAERDAERALERVETDAERDGLESATAIRRGAPHEEILAYAEENGIDMIVMGTHGRTGIDRALVGSVTERIVREASVPVVTVRVSDDLRIGDAADAEAIALEGLEARGYDDATTVDDPHRTSGSWIVPVETREGRIQVHVDAASGDVRLARLDG